jgi:hypothetical protein
MMARATPVSPSPYFRAALLRDNHAMKVETFHLDFHRYPQSDRPVKQLEVRRGSHYSAAASVSPVRILTACSRLNIKILPSPIWPVLAAAEMASMAFSA